MKVSREKQKTIAEGECIVMRPRQLMMPFMSLTRTAAAVETATVTAETTHLSHYNRNHYIPCACRHDRQSSQWLIACSD